MKIKRIFITLFSIVLLYTSVFALGATISAPDSINLGETINFTVNFGYSVGAYTGITVKANGSQIASEGLWVIQADSKNGITSKSYSFKPSSAGTYNIEFVASGVASYDEQSMGTVTASKSVVVKEVVNNTTNNTSNNTAANTQANTSNNTSAKSSNNYLKSLQVSEEGLTPNFNKNKTSYSLSVSEKVTSINVTALAEDLNAKVYVSGNTDLKDGDNNVYITVTAQNGSKRTYTIVVNKSADPQKANSYLTNLIIKDMMLSPEFSNEVLEYDGGTMKMSEDKLDIYAYPENENAKVEIIGNENLVDGENTVTIKVTSEDGTSTKEYVIKFVKETVEEVQALENDEENNEDDSNWFKTIFKDLWAKIKQNALILLMYLFVIVEFVQIVYLYNKVKKKDQEIARLKSLNLENTDNVNNNEEELTLLSESFKLPEIENSNEKEELSDFIEENIEETENVNNVENIDNENLNLSEEKEVIEESNEDDTQSQIDNMVKSIWDEDDRLRFNDDFNDETSSRSRRGKI